MKKTSLLILLLLSTTVFAQENCFLDKPKVDKRVELLSIVFRLAGSEEYSSTRYKPRLRIREFEWKIEHI